MGLHGNIATMSVEDMLGWLSMGTREGVLVMNNEVETKKIYLSKGSLIYAVSNTYSERVVSYFIRKHAVDAEAARKALGDGDYNDRQALNILLNKGLLTVDAFPKLVEELVMSVFYSIFAWNAGVFLFLDVAPPYKDFWPLNIGLQNMIMEGTRLADEHRRVRKDLAEHTTAAFKTSREKKKQLQAFLSQQGPHATTIFKLLRSTSSLDELTYLSPEPELETLKLVHGLMEQNLVKPVPRDASEQVSESTGNLAERADGLRDEGRLKDALQVYRQVLDINPDHPCKRTVNDIKDTLAEWVKEKIGPPSGIPIKSSEVAHADPSELCLRPVVQKAFEAIDDDKTIDQAARSTGMSKQEMYLALDRLIEMGYVTVEAQQAGKSSSSPKLTKEASKKPEAKSAEPQKPEAKRKRTTIRTSLGRG